MANFIWSILFLAECRKTSGARGLTDVIEWDISNASQACMKVEATMISHSASFQNSFGIYFEDSWGSPISGKIYYANTNEELDGNVHVTEFKQGTFPESATKFGFFLIPNGYNNNRHNTDLKNDSEVKFSKKSDGHYEAKLLNGETLKGFKNSVVFSNHLLNPTGTKNMDMKKDTGEEMTLRWEDGVDSSFDDLVTKIKVTGEHIIQRVEVVEETESATTTTTTTPTANRLLAIDGERQLQREIFYLLPVNLRKIFDLLPVTLLTDLQDWFNDADPDTVSFLTEWAGFVRQVGGDEAFEKIYEFVRLLTDDDIKAIKDLPKKIKKDIEIFRGIFEKYPCRNIEVLMGALMETVENLYEFDDIINLEKVKEIFDSIKEVGVKIALSVLADKMLDIASLTTGMDTLNIASFKKVILDNMSNNKKLLMRITKLAFSKSVILDNEELLIKIVKLAISNSVDFYDSFMNNLENSTIVQTNCPSKEVEVKEQEAELVGDVEELDQSDKTEDQKDCVGKKTNLLKEHQRFLVETSDNNQEIANSDFNMARGISVMALVALILI
jgi:hypothetical protein